MFYILYAVQIFDLQICAIILWLSFNFIYSVLEAQKFLILTKSNFSISTFSLVACALGII